MEELERRLDPLLSDIDGLKCSSSKLVAEGNENAINIIGEVMNHWAVFKLKVRVTPIGEVMNHWAVSCLQT